MPPAELTVRHVMTPNPRVVPPDCPVYLVMRMMNDVRIGAVPVLAGDALVGIFTERDLLRRVVPAIPGWRDYPVSDWMTANPHTITPDVDWDDAVVLMQSLRVRHLPVIENGRVIGILSTRALMTGRTEYLDRKIEERTRELRRANDLLLARDSEMAFYMRTAGKLQANLMLPGAPPAWPELSWGVHFAPLDHLGGDYYDYATPDPDHLGILVADASGHSIPAAMVAVMTRTAFAEVATKTVHPGEVLTAVNARLVGLMEERFVTAFYGVLNRRTRVFRYASAGHPHPYLVRPTGAAKPLVAQGFLLGIMPDEQYVERQATLEPGDRVCFYTDGLIEARNEIGEMYGTDRLTDDLKAAAADAPAEVVAKILTAQQDFCGREKLTDDLTLMVMGLSG